MKKNLLALSLIASGGLFAEQENAEIAGMNQSCCNTCYCTPCCCKPQPTECVSGVAYTAPFYDLQCDWGAFFDVEFLYWYAKETDLSYATVFTAVDKAPGSTATVMAASSYKDVDSTWDPGFRVGLGWNSDCDGWDVYLHYTWMRNRKTTSTSVPEFSANPQSGEQGILNPWINQSFHQDANPNIDISDLDQQFFDKVSAKWRLQWNVIDLEIGRKYWLSSCFNLRPYAAIRGAWWKTRFRTTSTKETQPNGSTSAIGPSQAKYVDRFTNRAWGAGLLGGLQPTWYFSCCFALYANFDVALIWGEHESKKRERYNAEVLLEPDNLVISKYSNQSKRKFDMMTPILDTAIGLRWEETWCCDRYRTTLDLGWEHHIYFDQDHRMKSFDTFSVDDLNSGENTGYRTVASEAGNIGLGGFVLRARFDF